MTNAAAPWRDTSSKRPSPLAPSLSRCSTRSLASGTSSVVSCGTRSMTSRVFPGARIVSPPAAWSSVPQRQRAHAPGPRGQTLATLLSSGPFRKPRCSSYGITALARSLAPDSRKNMAKARRGRSWALSSPGRSMTGCNGERGSIWPPFFGAQGGAQVRLRPPWGTMGAAGPACSGRPLASLNAPEPRGAVPCPCALAWTPAPVPMAQVTDGDGVLPLPRP